MTRHFCHLSSVLLCVTLLCTAGCQNKESETKAQEAATAANAAPPNPAVARKTAVAVVKPAAAATTQPTNNNVTGTVTFTSGDNAVNVVADIKGLTPNTTHGFHIHEKGDLSAPDLSSAGAHYNPMGLSHGGPPPTGQMTIMQRHMGDLGNLQSDAQGTAHLEISIPSATLGGEHNLVGRSVIIHAKADDLHTDPSGNSGGRIAGGVIELQN